MRRLTLTFPLLLLPYAAAAQGFQLTVENIMRGPALVGTAPTNVEFGADGRFVYFRWRAPTVDTLDQDYRVNVAGAPHLERLPRNAIDTIARANGVWSPLLICHGMVDDNVHFPDTARLINGSSSWARRTGRRRSIRSSRTDSGGRTAGRMNTGAS